MAWGTAGPAGTEQALANPEKNILGYNEVRRLCVLLGNRQATKREDLCAIKRHHQQPGHTAQTQRELPSCFLTFPGSAEIRADTRSKS